MNLLTRILSNAVAIWLATMLLEGLVVVGGDTAATKALVFVGVALVFGVVNALVKPIVKLLSLPLYLLTLGLFTLVVNAAMLLLTAWISEHSEYGLRVDNFGSAVIGAVIISFVSFVLSAATKTKKR